MTKIGKQWFVMLIGYDCGGPESGPIFRCSEEYFKAKSLEKAKERAEKILDKYGDGQCEGYSVYAATEKDMLKINEAQKFMAIPCPECDLPFN